MRAKDTPLGESPVSMVSGLRTGSRLHHLGQLKLEYWQSLLIGEPKEEFGITTASGKQGKVLERGTQREKAPNFVCKLCSNLWLTPEPSIHGADSKQLR